MTANSEATPAPKEGEVSLYQNTPTQQTSSPPPPPWLSSQEEGSSVPPTPPPAGIKIQQPIFKKLIPLVGILIVITLVVALVTKVILPLVNKGGAGTTTTTSGKKVTLTYWGLWEPENVMSSVIADYQKSHPNIVINYSRQSHKDYRERLQSSLARGDGPDIFRYHNTWIPMLKKDLAPAPTDIAQSVNITGNYYPVVASDVKIGSQIFGVPLEFDGLVLYYNTSIFKEAGKVAPTTWEDLRKTALDLTVRDDKGNINVAGVALGTTTNVDNFSDILGLMMLQNSADLSKPTGSLAEDALKFYTLFYTTDKVWDKGLPNSTYAFATGKVAMFFGPSWRAFDIKQINPKLEFKTVPVPQLPETKVAWATYWVEGVAAKSKSTKEAWDFLNYLSSKESVTKLYSNESQVRGFGEPYARIDLASELKSDPVVGAFVVQGPYAKSWYLCSQTYDNGINDKIIKYFEDAVNGALANQSITSVLTTASQGVTQVLSQYGIK
jgi:multiple sugar transport system substrate-binding protein